MTEFNGCYKEVTPYQNLTNGWKEITLNTGGTQSTLQDIKVVERSSGYSYKDGTKHFTRNRFIYWHISNDILDIVEQSLDLNLTGNKLRYKFVDTPILDGITVYEYGEHVNILVPTVCSVHRLVFPHPEKLHRQDDFLGSHPDLSVPSIFADASIAHARDPRTFYIFNNPSTNAQLPHCATSHFIEESEESLFLFVYPSNEIILVRQNAVGENETVELKHESIMPRFLSGIADKILNRGTDGNVVMSMVMHTFVSETYAFTITTNAILRIWNCSKNECISVINISQDAACTAKQLGTQNHILRKSIRTEDDNFLLAIHLSFVSTCQFFIYKTSLSKGQIRLDKISMLHSPGMDLVDYSLSLTSIWSVWRGVDGEYSVYTLDVSNMNGHWTPVILEPVQENTENFITPDVDCCQAYLENIFYPGRFPLSIIDKALSIYKRSSSDMNLSPAILKQRIVLAVENKIQSELSGCEVKDEEYYECANYCWSQFYSCCVQYYAAAIRPFGLLHLPNSNSSILLKKSMYSILRPVDIIEHLKETKDCPYLAMYIDHPQLTDPKVIEQLVVFISVLDRVGQQVNELFKAVFERELNQLRPINEILNEIFEMEDLSIEFRRSMTDELENIDLYTTMHKLLELLKMERPVDHDIYEINKDAQMSVNHMFSSVIGVSFVTESLKEIIEVRFAMCRNLLLLQHILLMENYIDSATLNGIQNICYPEIVDFTQAYYVLVWFNRLPTMPTLPGKSMAQRLAPLNLAPAFNLNSSQNINKPLLDLFVVSSAGYIAHKNLHKSIKDDVSMINWQESLLNYINHLLQIVWPFNANHLLAEWLLVSGQHVTLQNYVRLMDRMGEGTIYTRDFLLATAFLCTAEFEKACKLFIIVSKGITTDEFIKNKILSDCPRDTSPLMWYFLKVIYLFEHHGARSFAIEVANFALIHAFSENDAIIPTIYSIKFKHHLALKHYTEAYNSLQANPDIERQKANLRDFVKTLLEEKQLELLMSFPYTGLEQLFISILLTRARATDSINNVYYDILYAYHVKRGMIYMRLAANVMYEQAFRLIQYNSMESLEKQMKCYLTALNSLHLCDKNLAWVLNPSNPDLEEEVIVFPVAAGSQEEGYKIHIKQTTDIKLLEDIKRELEFTTARFKLAKTDPNTLNTNITTPDELVAILNNYGHYKTALQICTVFEIPCDSILQSLTQQCVILTRKENPNSWNWLVANDLHDLNIIDSKPSNVTWKLLETYLFQYESKNSTQLHKVVAEKLVTLKFFLPQWLLASYKLRNAGELIWIYHSKGYLDGAYKLASELLMAALGHGKEHFGFTKGMVLAGPALCLPVNIIDSLLYELELQNTVNPRKPFETEHKALRDLFMKYLDTSSRISNEVIGTKKTE